MDLTLLSLSVKVFEFEFPGFSCGEGVPRLRDFKTKRYDQQAFRYVAPSLWNVLPESTKEDSIQSFRPSLKTYLFIDLGMIIDVIVYVRFALIE